MLSRRSGTPIHPAVAVGALAFALAAHVAAGIADAGRAEWRPGGHLSLYAVAAWLLAAMTALDAMRHTGRARPLAIGVLLASITGIGLLLFPR